MFVADNAADLSKEEKKWLELGMHSFKWIQILLCLISIYKQLSYIAKHR